MYRIKDIFNDMAEEYDDISDLWYSWLFSRLHFIIAEEVICKKTPKSVLDIGCGTGFQSYLYAAAGCKVIGIDIAKNLIEIAKNKILDFNPSRLNLFPTYYDYVNHYNQLIRNYLKSSRKKFSFISPEFHYGDALKISYDNGEFDHINCCGSTLSFVPEHFQAISEMSRVLKKDGTFIIEVEGKWNFNMLWYLLDPFFRGKFKLNKRFRNILKLFTTNYIKNIWSEFPFGESHNQVNMKLKLFTSYSLKRDLLLYKLKVTKKWYIHSITSLIPCTLLDTQNPSKRLRSIFRFLTRLEERLPFSIPGSSLVLYGKKIN
jgi:ubiquinone/menaquinone biosynthesis C-methylase UbiE